MKNSARMVMCVTFELVYKENFKILIIDLPIHAINVENPCQQNSCYPSVAYQISNIPFDPLHAQSAYTHFSIGSRAAGTQTHYQESRDSILYAEYTPTSREQSRGSDDDRDHFNPQR